MLILILPHPYSLRLNIQHKYLTRVICDQRLVYDKGVVLDEHSCVLDSGTGTGQFLKNNSVSCYNQPTNHIYIYIIAGAWAVDLANEVPDSVEICAADVSPANFPPASRLVQ